MRVVLQPVIENFVHFFDVIEHRILLVLEIDLIDVDLLNIGQNLLGVVDAVLLNGHSLGINSACLGLVLSFDPELTMLLLQLNFFVLNDLLPSTTDGLHEILGEQIVIRLELEIFRQQLVVDINRQRHQTNRLLLHLSNQRLVLVILCRDQLGDEKFTELVGEDLRLLIKNLSQIVVIDLLGLSNLDDLHRPTDVRVVDLRFFIDRLGLQKDVIRLFLQLAEEIVQGSVHGLPGLRVGDGLTSEKEQDVFQMGQGAVDMLEDFLHQIRLLLLIDLQHLLVNAVIRHPKGVV